MSVLVQHSILILTLTHRERQAIFPCEYSKYVLNHILSVGVILPDMCYAFNSPANQGALTVLRHLIGS